MLAESALVEGSATALMTEYAVEHLAVSDLLDETGGLEGGAADLPDIAMAQVTFSYFGGQRFVDELARAADGGWDLVDFAYQRRLPATTEQILHPEKYLEDEGALPVPDIPDPGPGWEKVDARHRGRVLHPRDPAPGRRGGRRRRGRGRVGRRPLPSSSGARARLPSARTTAARTTRSRSSGAATTRRRQLELRTALQDFLERSLGGVDLSRTGG